MLLGPMICNILQGGRFVAVGAVVVRLILFRWLKWSLGYLLTLLHGHEPWRKRSAAADGQSQEDPSHEDLMRSGCHAWASLLFPRLAMPFTKKPCYFVHLLG